MEQEQIEDVDQLMQEVLIEEHKQRCDAFADQAEERGLVYYPDTGLYADEDGNAVNEYGERV